MNFWFLLHRLVAAEDVVDGGGLDDAQPLFDPLQDGLQLLLEIVPENVVFAQLFLAQHRLLLQDADIYAKSRWALISFFLVSRLFSLRNAMNASWLILESLFCARSTSSLSMTEETALLATAVAAWGGFFSVAAGRGACFGPAAALAGLREADTGALRRGGGGRLFALGSRGRLLAGRGGGFLAPAAGLTGGREAGFFAAAGRFRRRTRCRAFRLGDGLGRWLGSAMRRGGRLLDGLFGRLGRLFLLRLLFQSVPPANVRPGS